MRTWLTAILLVAAGTCAAAPPAPAPGGRLGFAVSVPLGSTEPSAGPLHGPVAPMTAGDIANNAMGGWLGIGILVAAGGVMLYQESAR